MSFGIGAFPLGFFTSSFNFGSEGVRPARKFDSSFIESYIKWPFLEILDESYHSQ